MSRKIKGETCDLCDDPAVIYEDGEFLCYRHNKEKKEARPDISEVF